MMMAITVIAVMANVSAIKAFNFLTHRNSSQRGRVEEAVTNRDILNFPWCPEISYRNFDRWGGLGWVALPRVYRDPVCCNRC